jgi:serine phosphatase RsbU (regulator of sigma subunit)
MIAETTVQRTGCIEWSLASCALTGQAVSGDLHLVVPWRHGVLLAVVDGLGHGEEATAAAQAALDVLERHAGEPVTALVQQCHRALSRTRGAVMTLASIDCRMGSASVIGVGNVEAMLLRADPAGLRRRETALLRGGVVGYKLPPLHADTWPIAPGDVLVFATDGLRADFADGLNPADAVPDLVEKIMTRSRRGTDDALVLVGKFTGRHES